MKKIGKRDLRRGTARNPIIKERTEKKRYNLFNFTYLGAAASAAVRRRDRLPTTAWKPVLIACTERSD